MQSLQTNTNASIVDFIADVTVNYVSYATEAGQFAEAGFESIICGPGLIEQAHRANEFITIEQLHLGVKMIENIVAKLSA